MPAAVRSPYPFRRLVALTTLSTLVALTACARGPRNPAPGDSSSAAPDAATASAPAPGGADDFGPAGDVAALRAAWKNESSGNDTIPQIVVVRDYGVVEVRNGGRNSPFLVLFERDSAGTWQDQGIIVGPLATCGLTAKLVPRDVAEQIVAHDTRLAATERTDPHAGCSGAL
jgi:hypothetical protein